jgi:hypothetical protein
MRRADGVVSLRADICRSGFQDSFGETRKSVRETPGRTKKFFERARPTSLLKRFATPNENLALSKEKNFHE